MKETAGGALVLHDRWADTSWLDSVLADLAQDASASVGIDVETKTSRKNAKAPDARRDTLVGVGVSLNWTGPGGEESVPVYTLARDDVLPVLQRRLPSFPWYAFNAMFDATVLRRYGVQLGRHAGDARIIAYLLGEPDAALKPLLHRWLQYDTLEYDEVLAEWDAEDISQVPVEVQADYCAVQDAAQCVVLERRMRQELPERSLQVYTGIELPMVNVLVEMSQEGIRFDRELGSEMLAADSRKRAGMDALIAQLVERAGFRQQEMRNGTVWLPVCKSCHNGKKKRESCTACGGAGRTGPVEKPFNPGSHHQVAEFLYDFLGAPIRRWSGGKTAWQVRQDQQWGIETGPATDALALLQLKGFHEVVPLLLSRAKYAKREGFERKWMELSEADGRLHTTFTNTTVVSGRLSSREPNLQQVKQDMRVLMTADP